ncbi:hypothetical protein V8B97DRAFT_2008696 [Scleroderma yunnanense]
MVILTPEKLASPHSPGDGTEVDLPPAYDAISLHPANRLELSAPSSAVHPAGSSNLAQSRPLFPQSHSDSDHCLSHRRSGDLHTTLPTRTGRSRLQKPRKRPSSSWLSLLPFTSARSAKQVRQSVLTIICDLVAPPCQPNVGIPPDPLEVLSSCANTCAERRISLPEILQEPSVADHTPMYWAIVNYRQELLVALLTFAGQLGLAAVSDVRRACLVSSSQSLFHALRVKRPPFHGVHGLRVPSLHAASDSLLLGSRPPDEVWVTESGQDGAFTVKFDVVLWQRRMRAVGRVSVEFIASGNITQWLSTSLAYMSGLIYCTGRMWCITFFNTDAPCLNGTRGKFRSGGTWHVMVTLLESSPPTYLDAQLVIEVPPSPSKPSVDHCTTYGLHPHSPVSPTLDKNWQFRYTTYDYNLDGTAHLRFSSIEENQSIPQVKHHHDGKDCILPPPVHPQRVVLQARTLASTSVETSSAPRSSGPPITLRLRSHGHKLARRGRPDADSLANPETLNTKADSWSDNGVSFTSAAIAPLAEGTGSELLYERSRYLLPDGTLRARLEAKLVKSELTKDCIIC